MYMYMYIILYIIKMFVAYACIVAYVRVYLLRQSYAILNVIFKYILQYMSMHQSAIVQHGPGPHQWDQVQNPLFFLPFL